MFPLDPLSGLIVRLLAAKHFNEAAEMTLVAMLRAVEERLVRSPIADKGRLLRAMLHLRPDDGYQRLFGIEHPDGEPVEGLGYLTSANVWRWVSEHRAAISIDVKANTLRTWLPEGASEPEKLRTSTGVPGAETRKRMIQREVTHVHAVPLRIPPQGGVIGMILLEARLEGTSGTESGTEFGTEFIWGDCRSVLDLLASVAAPYLNALPLLQEAAQQTDSLAPVISLSTTSMMRILSVFSRQEETILLSGATGVGKSRLARWCHAQSPRRDQAFETVRLLSVPEDLQMAELMGWRRGAFTGAVRDTPGALARAAKGTLYIDEIDKLSLSAQAGLLHVLEERRYRPLGDNGREQHADVRFIVSTNVDLHAAVRAGRFREDLYYRINVLPVRLPTLEERLDELPSWAEYMFRRRHTESGGEGTPSITAEAMELLRNTRWPGNLRQLDNIVRRAFAIMLADCEDGVSHDRLLRRHVEQALGHEPRPQTPGLVSSMWRVAHAFVDEAERRESTASPLLPLDLADAFRGLVLGAAIERRQSRDAAFVLLAQASLLRNRNHHRVLRRELEKVRALLEMVPEHVEPALAALLENRDSAEE